jgi:hypothetical protein
MLRSEIEFDVMIGDTGTLYITRYPKKDRIRYSGFADIAYCKKICLRCNKIVDEITPVYKEFEKKKEINAQRRKKAQKLLQEMENER